MRITRVLKIIMIVLIASTPAWAVFQTAPGYTAVELRSPGSTIGGMTLDAGSLYFGTGTEIKALDLNAANAISTIGTIPANVDIPVVLRHNGTTHTAFAESYSSPYQIGQITAGAFQYKTDLDGIYSGAVNAQGDCYIVANPGFAGSKIFKYDLATGVTTEIANVGGYSGGLTFDNNGDLYYADQGEFDPVTYDILRNASVIKFTAADLAAVPASGVLSAGDAVSVMNISAGNIGIDADGNLLAVTYAPDYSTILSEYDLFLGTKTADIAFGGTGQFAIDGETIYAVDTDWGTYTSTIQEITPIPEPATILLLAAGGLGFVRSRRRN